MAADRDRELSDAISNLIVEKTLTLDAVRIVDELRRKAALLEDRNAALVIERDQMAKQFAARGVEIDALKADAHQFETRMKGLQAREVKVGEHERNAAVSKAESATWEKACGLIFRNTVLREGIMTNHTTSGGSTGYVNTTTNDTKTATQE